MITLLFLSILNPLYSTANPVSKRPHGDIYEELKQNYTKEILNFQNNAKFLAQDVANASDTNINDYPHHVHVERHDKNSIVSCVGSIVSDMHVISAAHCFTDVIYGEFSIQDPAKYTIHVGSNFRVDPPEGQSRKLKAIHIHPLYFSNPNTLGHDLAVLQMVERFSFTNAIRPVRLPESTLVDKLTQMENSGDDCVVTGWGTVLKGIPVNNLLKKVNIQLSKPKLCKGSLKIYGLDIDTQYNICSLGDHTNVADSGSGLVCGTGDDRYILGVVTFNKESPTIFARVDTQLDFVKNSIDSRSEKSLTGGVKRSTMGTKQLVIPIFFIILLRNDLTRKRV